jgi:hypothetical protein
MGADASKTQSPWGHVAWYGQAGEDHKQQLIASQSTYGAESISTRREGWLPSETLIIFDWDDTLLCTTAINSAEPVEVHLHLLELTVQSLLEAAMKLGETLIVTNGNENWVLDSASRFLPGLLPTLRYLKVVSARAKYETYFPGDPFAWKRQAFLDILSARTAAQEAAASTFLFGQSGASCPNEKFDTNLVVIGDSLAEMEAAEEMSTSHVLSTSSVVKTVKFKDRPLATELLGQIRKMAHELAGIVEGAHSANKGLTARSLPKHKLEHTVAWASAWSFFDSGSWSTAAWPPHFSSCDDVELLRQLGLPAWVLDMGEKFSCGLQGHEGKFEFEDLDFTTDIHINKHKHSTSEARWPAHHMIGLAH